jgi:hypothetical protein
MLYIQLNLIVFSKYFAPPPVPSLSCDEVANATMASVASDASCAGFVSSLTQGIGLSNYCNSSCFTRYLHGYERMWNMSCFVWHHEFEPPAIFSASACTRPPSAPPFPAVSPATLLPTPVRRIPPPPTYLQHYRIHC